MKHLLLTTIAAVVLVGGGESQQSVPQAEAKPVEPVAEAGKPSAPKTDIHAAIVMGDLEAVKHHIAAGTDVNVKEKSLGRTPLHNAAYYVRKEIVELLIAGGANVNAKNDWGSGETPLDWAEGEIADLLRRHGGKRGAELKAEGK